MNSMEKLAGHLPAMKVGGRRRRSHTESSISLVKANLQEKHSHENPNKSHHELEVEWEGEEDKEPEVDHEKTRREEFLQKMKNTRLNNRDPQHNFQRNSSRRNNIQQPMKNMIAI